MPETSHRVASLSELQAKGRMLVKHGDKQVALFHSPKGVYARNNRCPHEGYPLSQGTLAEGCVLTCNCHNWKFDLESGDTMVGGDTLRRYPVALDGDDVILDLSDPPGEARIAAALEEIREAMDKEEYDRMARLVTRIERAGGNPLDALREAVRIGHDRMEFGMTRAFAAAPIGCACAKRRRRMTRNSLSPCSNRSPISASTPCANRPSHSPKRFGPMTRRPWLPRSRERTKVAR